MVHSKVVAFFQQHLRCHIFWTSTERVGKLIFIHVRLSQPEITYAHMTVDIKQNIFWLYVSINDVSIMEILDSKTNFSEIETCLILSHPFNPSDMIEKLSPCTVLHNKPQIMLVFECVFQLEDERVRDDRHNISLILNYYFLLIGKNELFVDELKSIHQSSIFFLHQINSGKSSKSYTFNKMKIF